MSNPVYSVDKILTPVVYYLLVDCQRTPSNKLNRVLVPLTPLDPYYIWHILSFAQSSPGITIEDFVHAETGIHIASGEIGDLLNPETLEGRSQLFYYHRVAFTGSGKNGVAKKRDMEIAKSAYMVSVWEALLAQMGKNALPYDGEVAAAYELDGRNKIANSMGGEKDSPEPFEILLFEVLGRAVSNQARYPVETLTLKLVSRVKGEGAEDFFEKF